MIYDKIENAKQYKGISENLDKALDFLINMDVDGLEEGKHLIDGDNVFYMVQDYTTKPADECKNEIHRTYIDIQLLVKGDESLICDTYEDPELTVPYNPDKDVEFYTVQDGYDFHLNGKTFAILFPGELHAPKVMKDKPSDVRKIVMKIKA